MKRLSLYHSSNSNQHHTSVSKGGSKPSIDEFAPKPVRAAKSKPRVFGDYRFDYITTMTHDLRIDNCQHYSKASLAAAEGTIRGNCPMCILVQRSTEAFFMDEARRKERERAESGRRGIEMRVRLLHRWARNQTSVLYNVPGSPPVVEISFCGKLGSAISAFKEMPSSTEMRNLLALRNRISEVGNFAAVYLQTRIRKHCCKRRMRRYLLRRFEFTPGEGFRSDSFFDSARGRRIYKTPVLLKNERANTPRTIQRRLNAEEKKRKLRLEHYHNNMQRGPNGFIDIWSEQTKAISNMRQAAILKDAIMVAWDDLRRLIGPSEDKTPVWVSFSNPAAPQYEFASGLALKTPAFERIVLNEELQLNTLEFFKLVNDRLRAFDEIAFDCQRCDTVDDALKFFFLEDMEPFFQSMNRIAEDPHIWDSTLRRSDYIMEEVRQKCQQQQAEFEEGQPSEPVRHVKNPKFLPLFMSLHPFDQSKGFASQFRLFFFEGNLIGATQVSKFSFIDEVFELRNSVINAVATYATSIATKAFIQKIQSAAAAAAADDDDVTSSKGDSTNPSTSNSSTTSRKLDLNWSKAPAEKEKVRMGKIYVPDESDVYIETPLFVQKQYSYDDYMTIGGQIGRPPKYKFIQKVSSFMASYTKAKKAGRPKVTTISRPAPPEGYMYNDGGELVLISRGPLDADGNPIVRPSFPKELVDTFDSFEVNRLSSGSEMDEVKKDKIFLATFEELALNTNPKMSLRMKPIAVGEPQAKKVTEKVIVAVDVHLDLPRIRLQKPGGNQMKPKNPPKPKKKQQAGSVTDQRRPSVASPAVTAYAGGVSQDFTAGPTRKLTAELDHIVGVFSIHDSCPSTLELGLFEWEEIQNLCVAAELVKEEKRNSIATEASEMTLTPDLVDKVTGIFSGERKMSVNGRLFLTKLLARPLSSVELHNQLPVKVKKWIGIWDLNDALTVKNPVGGGAGVIKK